MKSMRLLTNNPAKRAGLDGFGIVITDRCPLRSPRTRNNERYLATKAELMGHELEQTL